MTDYLLSQLKFRLAECFDGFPLKQTVQLGSRLYCGVGEGHEGAGGGAGCGAGGGGGGGGGTLVEKHQLLVERYSCLPIPGVIQRINCIVS